MLSCSISKGTDRHMAFLSEIVHLCLCACFILMVYWDGRMLNQMIISSTKTKSMAMWGNHIQRVKIVINDNIIEQVTDFKCLGYCISEFKSDVEDKLQTYNKINGAIRRHFGKQMNKETKLRIHNITA